LDKPRAMAGLDSQIVSETRMVELGKEDRRILKILQENNQLTNLELAERVNLSPPTCLRRVRRLREEQIIIADVSLVDPLQVGKNLFVFVEVALDRQTEPLQRAFEKKMNLTPEIMQCYMVSGDSDFLLVVQVADMHSYHSFVRRVLTEDTNIKNFRSSFAMSRTKFRTAVNLD
jgi:Lrp/AsnC family leucine-responsive transcriptional regulator